MSNKEYETIYIPVLPEWDVKVEKIRKGHHRTTTTRASDHVSDIANILYQKLKKMFNGKVYTCQPGAGTPTPPSTGGCSNPSDISITCDSSIATDVEKFAMEETAQYRK